ncbi:PPA1309 family protein [Actinoalloteichus spitiensis]|uniref:PPA1309 family protein n=1 Tax=Actinoalloteichus spitiensis TaxID=252394 RepID=UPI0003616223
MEPVDAEHDAELSRSLPAAAREVEDFVASGGWDQPIQLFALVSTSALLAREPNLVGQVDPGSTLTPVAQDALPEGDLAEALAGIEWPDAVDGCALAQEIVVLPPGADGADSEEGVALSPEEAANHPERREARLVAAVLRDGSAACVLRLRADDVTPEEIVEHPELAPNLVTALRATLHP